jgi:hypothetical protein
MVAALDWQFYLLGIATIIILIGGVLAALGQIGRAWRWVMQRFRPAPPRIELESSGGSHSQQRDEATVRSPGSTFIRGSRFHNHERVSVFAVTAGVVNPANAADRVAHPQKVPVLKTETPVTFGSMGGFQIPSQWLAGFAGADPHQGCRTSSSLSTRTTASGGGSSTSARRRRACASGVSDGESAHQLRTSEHQLQRSQAVFQRGTSRPLEPPRRRRNPPSEAGFGSTERRESRTHPAPGCDASPVLKSR